MFSKGSLHLGTYSGIPLKVHWTFTFIFVLVFGLAFNKKSSPEEFIFVSTLVLVSFLCVVLHEYGHALMAKRFDVRTIDIILSPIGGLARLERLPSKPLQEFFIAVAGPLVNLVIAILIAIILLASSNPVIIDLNSSVSNFENWSAYLNIVLYINLMLFLFNLIPAFPMDGGRILRSLLSIRLGKKRSTDIASWIGYVIAGGFVITGFFYSYYTLSIIGIFVLFMARGEKISARHEDFLIQNNTDLEGLLTYHSFNSALPMQEILNHYYEERARNYMVIDHENNLIGVVTEPAIKACIKEEKFSTPILDFTQNNYKEVETLNLQLALSIMNEERRRYLIVKRGAEEMGMLERYRLIEKMNKA
jgi:Zn-dependent protease